MNPLYPDAAEKARIRLSVGSSCVSSATLGLRPIQVQNFGAKSGSQVWLRRYRYRRSELKMQAFCISLRFIKIDAFSKNGS